MLGAVNENIYLGTNGQVVAIDKNSGLTLWQTKLKGGLANGDRFVTLLIEEGRVYAHTCGELFCLDAVTGEVLWDNGLEGLGYELASLAMEGSASESAPVRRRRQARDSGSADSNARVAPGL